MADLTFIPKREAQFETKPGPKFGLLGFGAFLLLIVSLILFGGSFFYKQGLNKDIKKMIQEIERQKEEFDPALINELILTSKNIEAAKSVVREHQIVSSVFALLEENTLSKVSFQKFADKKTAVSLEGESSNYEEIAKQVLILKANPLVEEIQFSRLAKSQNKINFGLEIILKPEILSYKP